MTPFDETPLHPHDPLSDSPEKTSPAENSSAEAPSAASETPGPTAPYPGTILPPKPSYPEDLQVSWSWVHLIVFLFFGFMTIVCVSGAFLAHYLPHQKMSRQQVEQFMMSKPQIVIGSTIVSYVAIFLFLYVTLGLLRGQPFWRSLGWRKIQPRKDGQPRNPLGYFFAGCGLSLFVALLSSRVRPPEHIPIEEMLRFRESAMLFIAMAVLVAPLVEETLFRGYLYPLFARSFGVSPAIILTGVLFGLMHGPQLGGAPSLVAVLILVGVIFTLVRARTGSVFASYLMHLGYNSLIAVALFLGTHGFANLPSNH